MITFLYCIGFGLGGLLLMALPGLRHHGGVSVHTQAPLPHAMPTHGLLPHMGNAHGGVAKGAHTPQSGQEQGSSIPHGLRLIPSPRMIFSMLVLYGACGYALASMPLVGLAMAKWLALLPAVLLERYAVTPYWNALFSFQSPGATSLEHMILGEAEAVTEFHNGRGIVKVAHDGRVVQMTATLQPTSEHQEVRVGDKLRIEDVDPAHERVTVSFD